MDDDYVLWERIGESSVWKKDIEGDCKGVGDEKGLLSTPLPANRLNIEQVYLFRDVSDPFNNSRLSFRGRYTQCYWGWKKTKNKQKTSGGGETKEKDPRGEGRVSEDFLRSEKYCKPRDNKRSNCRGNRVGCPVFHCGDKIVWQDVVHVFQLRLRRVWKRSFERRRMSKKSQTNATC